MLLTTKHYKFYVDGNNVIHFSLISDVYQPVRNPSLPPINKTLTSGKNPVSRFLQKIARKKHRAVKDYINTLLP